MKQATKAERASQNGFRATVEADRRLTMTASELGNWAEEGLLDLEELVSAPGFPAPTQETAELPLHQREWPAVYVFIFMFRKEGYTVLIDAEQQVDGAPSFAVKYIVTKPN